MWLWVPECEMEWGFGCLLVANQGEAQKQKYVSHVDGMSTSPGIFQYIRDQMPIPWRTSAPIQPYRTDPWRAEHLVLRCIFFRHHLVSGPEARPGC